MNLSENQKIIRNNIVEILRHSDGNYSDEEINNFAFHMTDWIDELSELLKLFSTEERVSFDKSNEILMNFLTHAPAHIIEAAEIYLGDEVKKIFR